MKIDICGWLDTMAMWSNATCMGPGGWWFEFWPGTFILLDEMITKKKDSSILKTKFADKGV